MRTLLRSVLCLGAVSGALVLAACFGYGNNYNPNPGILVSFSMAPPASVNVGGNFMVSAVVTDDNSNRGVNWTVSCGGASCGSFSAAQTASGTATTYTAPNMVPSGGTVTITATSITNSSRSASANVNVSAGNVAITFSTPPPPATLSTAANFNTASLTAVVANDPLSQGVDWSVTCAAAPCGSFSSAHTASGVATSYTAPAAPPPGGTVTITAKSTTDPAVAVSAVITLSASTPASFFCAGCSYTYFVGGSETSGAVAGFAYAIAGVFTTDGMGNITGGEQDFSDTGFTTGSTPDSLTGHYTIGPDGRGTITLMNGDSHIFNGMGMETLAVVFLSANHMLVTQQDTFATGSGTMDLRTLSSFSQSSLSGGYAFVFAGSDLSSSVPVGFGGVFNVDSAGGISGAGSVADVNFNLTVSTQQGLNGSYPAPDNFGRTLLTVHSSALGNAGPGGPAILATYINDAAHLKCVEVDSNFGITSGLAVGQGTSTGKLGAASVLPAGSSYVFGTFGSGTFGPVSLVTTFTSDGTSMLQNGTSDVSIDGVSSSGMVSGMYSVASSGVGRVAVNLSGNVGKLSQFAVYLSGGSDPAMVLELDIYGATSGLAFQQASGPFTLASFQGFYGLNYTFENAAGTSEEDVSGQLFADGAGKFSATFDVNVNGAPVPDVGATGAYASAASGRFTGSFSSATTGMVQVSYYVVSPSLVVITETDSNGITLGVFEAQSPPF